VIYLPDTNAWIGLLRRTNARLVQQFEQVNPEDLRLCSIVLGELLYGVSRSHLENQAHNLALVSRIRERFLSLPFDDIAAEAYGRIRSYLAGIGMPIGPNDLLIASIASANGMILVTHNVRDFGRVPGLIVEDWETT